MPYIGFLSVLLLIYITLYNGAELDMVLSLSIATFSAILVLILTISFVRKKKKKNQIENMSHES